MAQIVYRADNLKWMFRLLKILAVFGIITAIFWLIYNNEHDFAYLIVAVFASLAGIITVGGVMFTKPRLIISDDELKLGRVQFRFADVIDVKHYKDEYTFFLVTRRRMTVRLTDFSARDKKEIDRLLAERCLKALTEGNARERAAGAADTGQFEFSFRARRSMVFFTVYLLILIFGGITALLCLLLLIFGGIAEAGTATLLTLVVTLALGGIAYITEKRIPKVVFEFRDDTFTLWRKGKARFQFARDQVRGVGINPNGQPYITFRIKDNGKKYRLPLAPFTRSDSKQIKENLRGIFFLPDEKAQNKFDTDPFKLKS